MIKFFKDLKKAIKYDSCGNIVAVAHNVFSYGQALYALK